MGSSDVVARLRRGYEAYNRGEIADPEDFTDDFVLEQLPTVPGTEGVFPGTAGMLEARAELLEGWDEFRFDPENFQEIAGHVVVRVRITTRTRGIEQTGGIIHVWDVRNGKLARCRVFGSRADALAAID